MGHDGVDERHLGVDRETVQQLHGQGLDEVGGHTVGPGHRRVGGVGGAVARGAAHGLHQGQHRHLEELLSGGEGVAEQRDVVCDS